MKKLLFGIVALTNSLIGQQEEPFYPPEEIAGELSHANEDLARAQKMFNPWYTGPILAGSASMMPPGLVNIQPYFFNQDNFATYNNKRKSVDHADFWQINPNLVIVTGITSWMDISLVPNFSSNNIHSIWHTGFSDLPISLGFKICDEGVYRPKMKFQLNESFPTGKYQHLSASKEGTDAMGSGSYITGLSFRASKILFWWTQHPLATRLVMTYNIPSTVHVEGLNSYGGGHGTSGRVRPGNSFNTDIGLEWSLSQKWVIATDLVYQTTNRTKFSGKKGINPKTGLQNPIAGPSSDYLQIAPAIEYNYNENLGFIGGAWFTVYGRNTSHFINYVLSVSYTFSVK